MIAALLITLLASAPAQDTLSIADRSAERLSPVTAYAAGSSASVSDWLFSPYDSYTTLSSSWEYRGEEWPLLREEGQSGSEGVIDIGTMVRLDENSAVRGKVQYRNGLKIGVMWNSSSDYDILRPYAVADSVGGDVKREQYSFSGGYAARSGRIHYGFEGAYRALHEYRMVDPRPRNIVSDLSIKAGAGFRMTARYLLDFSVAYRRYSQSQNISFYSQKGSNSSVFHLTGLGSHFGRFEGGTSAYTTTRYAGNGLDVSLNMLPDGVSGWRASLNYSIFSLVHHLPNQNEVPYSELYTRTAEGKVSYVSQGRNMGYAMDLHLNYESRSGVEIVIDNGSAGRFLELMRFAMYSSDLLKGGVRAVGEWRNGFSLEADADYIYLNSDYVYPSRNLNSKGADINLRASYISRWNDNLLKVVLKGGRYQSLGASLSIPAEYTMDKLLAFYSDRRSRFASSSLSAGASVRWEKEIRTFSLFLLADADYVRLDGGADSVYSTVTIGFNF
ncbi:MAG: hypothetical protein IJM29_01450 [Bacteroidales bacterium]|nr:hypothetical protein [Bacteroidales bacterium]